MDDINRITGEIVDAAYHIHDQLGPGLLESVYQTVLAHDLEKRGFTVEREKEIDFVYQGIPIQAGFKVDLLVNSLVVIELKSVEKLAHVHTKQILTYLRLLELPVGLLINFGAPTIKEGIRRIANPRAPTARSILGAYQP
jgi:GxxExxY protein